MVIPTKTVSCKRCWGYTHSWSSWILWYWFHKVTQVFMSVESKNSTENHFFINTANNLYFLESMLHGENIKPSKLRKSRNMVMFWNLLLMDKVILQVTVLHTSQFLQLMPKQAKLSILGLFTWRFETAFIMSWIYLCGLSWQTGIQGKKWWEQMKGFKMSFINLIHACTVCIFPAFSCISTEYWDILRISSYSVQMQEITDQNNFKYQHFLRSDVGKSLLKKLMKASQKKGWKSFHVSFSPKRTI